MTLPNKMSLKILKGKSEFVSRRRTDNTMAIRKGEKRTNNDLQSIALWILDIFGLLKKLSLNTLFN